MGRPLDTSSNSSNSSSSSGGGSGSVNNSNGTSTDHSSDSASSLPGMVHTGQQHAADMATTGGHPSVGAPANLSAHSSTVSLSSTSATAVGSGSGSGNSGEDGGLWQALGKLNLSSDAAAGDASSGNEQHAGSDALSAMASIDGGLGMQSSHKHSFGSARLNEADPLAANPRYISQFSEAFLLDEERVSTNNTATATAANIASASDVVAAAAAGQELDSSFVRRYIQMNANNDHFPILVRRDSHPELLSASTAALDLSVAAATNGDGPFTPGPQSTTTASASTSPSKTTAATAATGQQPGGGGDTQRGESR
ncbi:hypothetical protein SYNPS1DRAFT_31759 [Syncephalis pseudoplumigaleata]|uniref:Uncharacterized protein n=1 Tax=Syncephalis pseudoplumigaleata TaxID=1712513 RepID=A0A4P9YTY2_9FUNG|nr:hypothetical protein SYNPS1DRAFT_31759 [Syncephalis pseudoplumigaleata]|eukprot:RKP22631.1 hypothetical protein SYNPS1DRAFT_31759 [Syncephalis pseudoplumigaleata]